MYEIVDMRTGQVREFLTKQDWQLSNRKQAAQLATRWGYTHFRVRLVK